MTRQSGKIDIIATALSPLIHSAGNAGNASIARVDEFTYFDDEGFEVDARTPILSGNSLRHLLREAAIRHALSVMGIEGGLSKAKVDLLFSGGHLGTPGASVDIGAARQIAELFPPLAMFGYSAGNTIVEGRIRVDFLHLLCRENLFRMPEVLRSHPMAKSSAASRMKTGFLTRRDQTFTVVGQKYLSDEAMNSQVEHRTKLLDGKKDPSKDKKPAGKGKKDDAPATAAEARGESAQMIATHEMTSTHSVFFGGIHFRDLTDNERAALACAIYQAACDQIDDCPVVPMGAATAKGYGRMRLELATSLRVARPEFTPTTALAAGGNGIVDAYAAHLRDRKDEIMAAIDRVAA